MMDTPKEGLEALLEYYGVRLGAGLVLDPQNEPFPMQVPRKVGNSTVVEIQQIAYPFFVDVRQDGMSEQSVIVSGLPAVTLQWASPVEVDPEKNKDRQVVTLLKSTQGLVDPQLGRGEPRPEAVSAVRLPGGRRTGGAAAGGEHPRHVRELLQG